MMENDDIAEVRIDAQARLCVHPATSRFPNTHREPIGVAWDDAGGFLYSPVPREWSYADWFHQILAAASFQSRNLLLTPRTRWTNVPEEVRAAISLPRFPLATDPRDPDRQITEWGIRVAEYDGDRARREEARRLFRAGKYAQVVALL